MQLADYLPIVRRRLASVLVVTALVVVAAVVMTSFQTPVYASKGRLVVAKPGSIFGTSAAGANEDFVQTEIQILQGQSVQSLVQEKLGRVGKISAVQVGTTSVVELSAKAESPRRAADTVNAYMEGYLTFRRQQATEGLLGTTGQIQAAIDELQKEIDSLTAEMRSIPCPATGDCPARTALEQDRNGRVTQQAPLRQKLAEINIDASAASAGAVITPATPQDDPVSPNPLFNGAVGLILGGLAGVAVAILFERLDDSVDDLEDVARAAPDTVVLATVPEREGDRDGPAVHDPFQNPQAEAYQILRASIRLLAVDKSPGSIQVTSASTSEGKTTTAANLGLALSRSGERVVLVDCHLRWPGLHDCFGVGNQVGLTSVLAGQATLKEALQNVSDDRRLWLLPAGPRPPNPSDLLASARASEVLSMLQSVGTVIVDCPPLLATSDAAILSAKVDATLLVVRARMSSRKMVSRALETLRQIRAPLLGVVVHGMSGDMDGDGYRGRRRTGPSPVHFDELDEELEIESGDGLPGASVGRTDGEGSTGFSGAEPEAGPDITTGAAAREALTAGQDGGTGERGRRAKSRDGQPGRLHSRFRTSARGMKTGRRARPGKDIAPKRQGWDTGR